MKKKIQNNIKIPNFMYVFILIIFALLLGRCCYLSMSKNIDGIDLQLFASKRTTKKEVLSAKRGTIYDASGEVLAQNVYSYTLIAYLSPSRGDGNYVKDKEYTAKMLATVINMKEEKILELLNKNAYQTEFSTAGKGLTELVKDKILALDLDGIDFTSTQKRYYPKGNFLSYTLGYAKQNENGEIIGEMGLEKLYNKELTGTDGYLLYQKDLKGYKISNTKEVTEEAMDGNNIYLTIDSSVQFLVEQAIDNVKNKYNFEQLNIVVAEAKTGKILAISTYPSFDPNVRDIKNYLDPNISVAIEPGSTMKIFAYMAVMESGKYNGDDTFKSGSFTTSDGTVIRDANRQGWGTITYDRGFALSSNVGIVNLVSKNITKEELLNYYKRLGFGSKTGIELANESSGKISFNYETEFYNAAFGQGVLTTSLQYIKALTAVANDGVLLQPYLVDKIVDSKGNIVHQNGRVELDVVASKETTDKIKDLMEDVVQEGTGSIYKMDGYSLIAKTGTAQISSTNGTGYLKGPNDYIRGFAGIYPKDDPDIIIYANMVRPNPDSAKPLSVLIKEVVENISKIRENSDRIPQADVEEHLIEDYINYDVDDVLEKLKENDISYIVIGDGDRVIEQYPKNINVNINDDRVFLLTNFEHVKLPSFIGWSKREVETYFSMLNVKPTFDGVGYVKSQNFKSGTYLEDLTSIEFYLEKKY